MIPYYEQDGITLYHGDCRDILPTFPDKSFDLVLTDPPYGTTKNEWDMVIPFDSFWPMVERVRFGRVVFTGANPFTAKAIVSNLVNFKYEIIWRKTRKTGFLNARIMPLMEHENILVFYGGCYNPQTIRTGRHINGQNTKREKCPTGSYGDFGKVLYQAEDYKPTSVLDFSNVPPTKTVHPTQKPIALFDYLAKTYSDDSSIILDPFCGSGTTLVAAKQLGRKAVGIEIEEKYCEIAVKRLAQMELFL